MLLKQRIAVGVGFLSLVLATPVKADQYHYHNIIVGDRAMGMGGAYGAVSDDASGVVYNPAGLGFALSNDISGSANAFYQRKVTYKKTVGNADFVEHSEGLFNPFFGGLQKLDHISSGLVMAFGVYSQDAELKDQNDVITDPTLNIERFHRAANVRASTSYMGLAVAKRISNGFSIGFGLNYLKADELVQVSQDAITTGSVNGKAAFKVVTVATREKLHIDGAEPVIGFQWAPGGRFAVGLTYKQALLFYQYYEITNEKTAMVVDSNKVVITDAAAGGGVTVHDILDERIKDPMANWPSEMRLAFAWFASPRLLWTFDAIQHGMAKAKSGSNLVAKYSRNAVTNFASGTEYYITPSFPLRLGLFTNNDARPNASVSDLTRDEHIDYLGLSLFFAWVQSNSQVALGTILQKGTGKANKISGGDTLQDVEALAMTFGLSATHNF